jgi:hypothetical protein
MRKIVYNFKNANLKSSFLRCLALLLSLLFFSSLATASVQKEGDDILNVQLFVSNSSLVTNFGPPTITGTRRELSYEPNLRGDNGLSIGYRNLGFGLSSQNKNTPNDPLGVSSTQNYSVRLLGKNSFEASHQQVRGFYLKNSLDEFNTGYYLKPEMKVERTSAQWIYNFHDKDISLPALFNYSGRQTSSAWGLLVFLNTNRVITSDQGALIPASQSSNFSEFAEIKDIDRFSFGGGVGLAGALAYGGFQMGALLTLGNASNQVRYTKTDLTTEAKSDSSSTANIFLNLGYNGKKHQVGASWFLASNTIEKNKERLDQQRSEIKIFYGYRIGGVNLGSIPNSISSWFD